MNLKTAREIARKVGATIEEKTVEMDAGDGQDSVYREKIYLVRLGVVRISENGGREEVRLEARSPREAADLSVVETGRVARALVEVAKKVYVDSDLIFGANRS